MLALIYRADACFLIQFRAEADQTSNIGHGLEPPTMHPPPPPHTFHPHQLFLNLDMSKI